MGLPEKYTLAQLDESRLRDVVALDAWAYPTGLSLETLLALPQPLDWERTAGITRTGSTELAAMHTAYSLRAYPVPGAEVACGWLSWVGVHPGHRRRGLLRAMIEHHLADVRARGENISALFAAEPAIYGRFGYGLASTQLTLTLSRGAALRPVTGSDELEIELIVWDADTHAEEIGALHRDYASLPEGLGRPGWAHWETPELAAARNADPVEYREKKEALRLLVVRDTDGTALAYARFRRTDRWGRGGPEGTVAITDAVAHTPAAAHRMWSVLLDLDLMSTCKSPILTLDDPLLSLLVDIRAAQPDYQDNTWLRIVDLPAALSERRYSADVDVVLDITDALIPENAGRWRVRATAGAHALVERSTAEPDLSLDIRELSSAHLGSISLAALAQSGFVTVHHPDALPAAASAWSWPVSAGVDWIF